MRPATTETVEARLRAAIDKGDEKAIMAAGAEMDAIEAKRPKPQLLPSALWYASLGIPTFALRPGIKHPFGGCRDCKPPDKTLPKCAGPHICGHDQCHGFLDATTDPERLARWWKAKPTANIGLATGHVFDVVDIDGPEGHRQRSARWDEVFAKIDADSLAKVLTPRPGGMHIYVPPTGDPNSTNIVKAVDYRGIGGYVVAPPSVIAPGGDDAPGTYTFLGTPRLSTPTAAA